MIMIIYMKLNLSAQTPTGIDASWMSLLSCFSFFNSVSPGGRGMDGGPVIVFPEFPTFGELEEEEVQNVLSYLTSIPKLVMYIYSTHFYHVYLSFLLLITRT